MNIYRTEFFSTCPVNRVRVHYHLKIETDKIISVEELLSSIATKYAEGLHEAIADELHATFGGSQTLMAYHHGVNIETTRP